MLEKMQLDIENTTPNMLHQYQAYVDEKHDYPNISAVDIVCDDITDFDDVDNILSSILNIHSYTGTVTYDESDKTHTRPEVYISFIYDYGLGEEETVLTNDTSWTGALKDIKVTHEIYGIDREWGQTNFNTYEGLLTNFIASRASQKDLTFTSTSYIAIKIVAKNDTTSKQKYLTIKEYSNSYTITNAPEALYPSGSYQLNDLDKTTFSNVYLSKVSTTTRNNNYILNQGDNIRFYNANKGTLSYCSVTDIFKTVFAHIEGDYDFIMDYNKYNVNPQNILTNYTRLMFETYICDWMRLQLIIIHQVVRNDI